MVNLMEGVAMKRLVPILVHLSFVLLLVQQAEALTCTLPTPTGIVAGQQTTVSWVCDGPLPAATTIGLYSATYNDNLSPSQTKTITSSIAVNVPSTPCPYRPGQVDMGTELRGRPLEEQGAAG